MKRLILFFLLVTQCFALPDAVREFSKRIVYVVGESARMTYSGTGWWINSSLVCTAWHVIDDASRDEISVEMDGRSVKAEIVAVDKSYDIAILRPVRKSNFDPVRFEASPDYLDPAYICGYAAALKDSSGNPVMAMAESKIAAVGVSSDLCPSGTVLATMVFSGTSGSPAITPDGRVLGIVLGTLGDDGEQWFATLSPASRIQSLLR